MTVSCKVHITIMSASALHSIYSSCTNIMQRGSFRRLLTSGVGLLMTIEGCPENRLAAKPPR